MTPEGTDPVADEKRLAELGYKQELDRGWTKFTNFAISFSIISVHVTNSVTRHGGSSSWATTRGATPIAAAFSFASRSADLSMPSSEVSLPGTRTTQSRSPKRTR